MENIPAIEVRIYQDANETSLISLVHRTIKICYPRVYGSKVVDFFLEYHSREAFKERYKTGTIFLLYYQNILRGCGYLLKNEIGGVYVETEYQRQGLGKLLIREIIKVAKQKKLRYLWLDATPLAYEFYASLGFVEIDKKVDIIQGEELEYCKMHLELFA